MEFPINKYPINKFGIHDGALNRQFDKSIKNVLGEFSKEFFFSLDQAISKALEFLRWSNFDNEYRGI